MWNKVIQAARLVGLPAEELCERALITDRQRKALQAKDGALSVPQIGRLSEKTGLPFAFFLQDVVPTTAKVKLRHDFNIGNEGINVQEMHYWRNRELFRLGTLVDTMLKTEAFVPKKQALPSLGPKATAQDIAEALGIEKLKAPVGPKLLSVLRDHGLLYFVYPIWWVAKMGGASWWHRKDVPVAAVDCRHTESRAYFTLAHEAVHLIKHLATKEEGHTCRLDPYMTNADLKTEERHSNEIASELLMPDNSYDVAEQAVEQHGIVDAVAVLSADWLVSRQATAIRLVNWDLADDNDIRRFFVRPKKTPGRGGGPPPRPHDQRFGSPNETARLVHKMYDGGASTRFIEWAAKLPYEYVFETIQKAEGGR
jgi:Zn-dependent peptidase ImmA (M78 family)